MRRFILCAALTILALGFACSKDDRTVVLRYSDFGPQAMAWKTIGMEWPQWDDHGSSDPDQRHDVNVVVYRRIPLSEVKRLFPVAEQTDQDYRYLSYTRAIEYLNRNIGQNVLPELTERLRKTKKIIIEKLGRPNDGQNTESTRDP